MTDVFISYSRKDIPYARLLHEVLKEHGFETWIDWQDIPPSTDWLNEVYIAIQETDTFIFILSASSTVSDICKLEIEHAKKNNKRLIPIVIDNVNPATVHPVLAAINWIFSRTNDEFQPAIESLIQAIQTDYEWVKTHTRLQIRALEWERTSHDKSFLLHGTDLQQAESWIAAAADKTPEPTLLQTQYLQASRQETAKRQRTLLLAAGAALAITVVLGVVALINGQRATRNAVSLSTQVVVAQNAEATAQQEAEIRATQQAIAVEQRDLALSRYFADKVSEQISENNWELALLLGVEAGKLADTYESDQALRAVFASSSHSMTHLEGHLENITGLAWSPDRSMVATASKKDGTIRLWDASSGELVHLIETEQQVVSDIDFSPDGTRILGTFSERGIGVWDTQTGQPLFWIPEQLEEENAWAFWSSDGSAILGFFENWKQKSDNDCFTLTRFVVYDGFTGNVLYFINDHYSDVGPIANILNHEKTRILLWQRIEDGYVGPYGLSWDTFIGKVIDWQTGEVVATLPESYHWLYAIWSMDGSKLVLSDEDDDLIRVWELDSGELLAEIPLLGDYHAFSLNPSGSQILVEQCDDKPTSVCFESSIHIWDVRTSEEVAVLRGFPGEILDTDWSPDGKWLAVAYWHRVLKTGSTQIWDAQVWRKVGEYQGYGSNEWDADSNHILSIYDGQTFIWESATGSLSAIAPFDPDFYIWDQADGKILMRMKRIARLVSMQPAGEKLMLNAHRQGAYWSALHPSGQYVLTSGCEMINNAGSCQQGGLLTWDVATGQLMRTFEGHLSRITRAYWNRTGDQILSISWDKTARVWDANSGDQLLIIQHPTSVTGASWSPDESKILTYLHDLTHQNNNAYIWDAHSGELLLTISPVEGIYSSEELGDASWSPDGSKVLTYLFDMGLKGIGSRAQVWDAQTGEELLRLELGGGSQSVTGDALWNQDGSLIYLYEYTTSMVGVWDANTGSEVWSTIQPGSLVNSAAWSPDGTQLAVGMGLDSLEAYLQADGIIRIFDSQTGEVLKNLVGQTSYVRQLIWSRDGTQLMTRSDDNTIRIWNTSTGELLRMLPMVQGGVNSVEWSPDERYILTSHTDGTVRIWFTEIDDLMAAACEIAPRNMSQHEWDIYFRGEPYRRTCP